MRITVSGEAARTFCTKSVTALLPCTVAVGLFGLFRNTRPAPFAAAAMRVEVEAQRRVDLDLGDRMPEPLRELRAVLERRRGGDQAAGRRRERADGALQNLLRAGAEHDVLGLGPELRRDGGDERAVGGRAVERIAPGLGELAHDRVERRLARAERVLVAADADGLDAGRQRRSRRWGGTSPVRPAPVPGAPSWPRAAIQSPVS